MTRRGRRPGQVLAAPDPGQVRSPLGLAPEGLAEPALVWA
jgi:hypothetical protein